MRAGFEHTITTTKHYQQRCYERGIPQDAVDVVTRFGERMTGRAPGEVVWHLSRLIAWQHAPHRRLWDYVGVVVIILDGHLAVTAFRITEDQAAQRRRQQGGLR